MKPIRHHARSAVFGIMLGALVCAGAAPPACAHATPVVEDCSKEAAGHLLDDVNTAIATGDWQDQLANLVARFGSCVIEKAVAEIAKAASGRAQYDSLEATKAQRARDWLSARGKPIAAARPAYAPPSGVVMCTSTTPETCPRNWDGSLTIDWDSVMIGWPDEPLVNDVAPDVLRRLEAADTPEPLDVELRAGAFIWRI